MLLVCAALALALALSAYWFLRGFIRGWRAAQDE